MSDNAERIPSASEQFNATLRAAGRGAPERSPAAMSDSDLRAEIEALPDSAEKGKLLARLAAVEAMPTEPPTPKPPASADGGTGGATGEHVFRKESASSQFGRMLREARYEGPQS